MVLITSLSGSYYYADTSAQKADDQTKALSLQNLKQNGSPIIGNISAPVTVIDFSDSNAPFAEDT